MVFPEQGALGYLPMNLREETKGPTFNATSMSTPHTCCFPPKKRERA